MAHATAIAAIRYSEQYNEISTCQPTDANRAALLAASDGHAAWDFGMDYWKDDPEFEEDKIWRVAVQDE